MKIPAYRISAAALALATLLVLAGCATPRQGMQNNTRIAPTPAPLAELKIIYISSTLYPDASQGHARAQLANILNPYGNHTYTHSEIDRAKQTIALEKHGLDKIDGRVTRLAPAILQQHGLKGEIRTYVTPYRVAQVADAASSVAKSQGIGTEYWLVIYPTGAKTGSLTGNVDFHATLSNVVDRQVYWQADYSTPGNPVDDAQVQVMLTAFIQSMTKP